MKFTQFLSSDPDMVGLFILVLLLGTIGFAVLTTVFGSRKDRGKAKESNEAKGSKDEKDLSASEMTAMTDFLNKRVDEICNRRLFDSFVVEGFIRDLVFTDIDSKQSSRTTGSYRGYTDEKKVKELIESIYAEVVALFSPEVKRKLLKIYSKRGLQVYVYERIKNRVNKFDLNYFQERNRGVNFTADDSELLMREKTDVGITESDLLNAEKIFSEIRKGA